MANSPDTQKATSAWHSTAVDEAISSLQSNPAGLTSEEAEARLQHYGANRLQQEQARPWYRRFLDQFNNILMLILIVAAIASALLGHHLDAAAILGVVVIIALIGFIQEGKAEQAIQSIRNMLSPQATVLRDGKRRVIDAETVVPGDVVLIESGDRVPADLRLIEVKRFCTDEAALTGESIPVNKDIHKVANDADLAERSSIAYASTIVVQGTAKGLVVATGTQTEIGKISELVRGVEQLKTPLLRQLDRAGSMLAFFILGAAALTAAIGMLFHHQPVDEMFMAAVGLAVAAIPEGLPAIVTISLALGVQRMAKRKAIIRRLPAVETLGSISTIFSDKTGTLTRNEMTATAVWLGDSQYSIEGTGFSPEGRIHLLSADGQPLEEPTESANHTALRDFLTAASLCNDAELANKGGAHHIVGDPTEGALIVAASKAGINVQSVRERYPRIDAIPFESDHKYMATVNELDGEQKVLIKGAPDRLLEMSSHTRSQEGRTPIDLEEWEQRIEALSAQGLRVLAIAETTLPTTQTLDHDHIQKNLTFLGLIGLLDPPREEVIEAVQECLRAGIRPVMITGDHATTALSIAKQLGFSQTTRVVTGREIEAMSDAQLEELIADVDVFARASPEHKLRLVQAMQAKGGICAMTGDGVNDGPALKRADVGVAMGIQGTEAAKDASEMVLADDNFATIVNAIAEGRKVYDNIRKTITFILPTNGAQGLAIMLAVLAGTNLPITPLQALWVNMIVAITLGLALAFEESEQDLMQRQPRNPKAALLDMFLLWRVIFVSLLLLASVFSVFSWTLAQSESIELARTAAVNMLVLGSAAYLINSRFLLNSTFSLHGLFSSAMVWLAIGAVLLLQLAFTYWPIMQVVFASEALAFTHWLFIVFLSAAIYTAVEIEKAVWRRRR